MEEEVELYREKGNKCVKDNNFAEAVIHYTHAIKLDPTNHALYSNRSYAFLKLDQYYLSMEDADQTIRLKPYWAKGYFRKAEIEFATGHYKDALLSYGVALKLQPNDPGLMDAIVKANTFARKEEKADQQIPWVGAGIGIIIGVILVIADYTIPEKPSLKHPIVMALLTIAIAVIGYFAAWAYRYLVRNRHTSLLEAPVDLLKEFEKESQEDAPENAKNERNHRYTKAQARQRFKKGRS